MEKVGSVFFFVGGKSGQYKQVKFDYQGNTVEETFSVNVVRKHKPNSQAFVFLPHSLSDWEKEKEVYENIGDFGVFLLPSIGSAEGKIHQTTYELYNFTNTPYRGEK